MFSKSRNKNNNLPSIISADTQFHGNISSQGEVQIDGRVIGDIHAKILTIHENAHIEGNVIAEELNLHGHIIGNVHAGVVHMFLKSHIEGNVTHEHIAINAGAFINGKCQRQSFSPPDLSDTNIYQYPAHKEDDVA